MLTRVENETLTRTGAGTPMGSVFRSYWMPALLSRELAERDGAPKRVKLLGEDFVAFRDSEGHVGIVEPHCPHRGANLFFGRNEACGIRCVYHGWKFDVHGRCLEMPTLPDDVADRIRPKASIRALEVREWGDVIWAYLGPGDAPPLPQFEFATVPATQRYVSKKFQHCNWAQAVEGGLDTAHFSYLHAGVQNGEKVSLLATAPGATTRGENEPPNVASFRWMANDGMPRFTVMQHDAGLVLAAARNTDGDDLYWRVTQFLMPNHSLAPGSWPGGVQLGNTWVPIDDESCWIFCYAWHPDRVLTNDERERWRKGSGIFPAMDDSYVPIRNRGNDYLIDRKRQRESSYTGIEGISEQDAAIADSQGLVVDRTRELLGQTDLGIVRFRQMMLAASQTHAAGGRPHGVDSAEAYTLRSGDTIAPRDAVLIDVLNGRFGEKWGVTKGVRPLS